LDFLEIPYQIIEAQDHVGGRLFTYEFPDQTGAPYNYYDVGAMRFPEIDPMRRLWHLLRYPPLKLESRLQEFIFTSPNAFVSFNGVTLRRENVTVKDQFLSGMTIWDTNPEPYLTVGYKAIVDDVIGPFAKGLLDDLKNNTKDGWIEMMRKDSYSTRSYMCHAYQPNPDLNIPQTSLPTDVVNWLETFDKSTGWYDRAFSETVLEAVAFGWQPGPDPPETKWWCVE
jgi:hypothetical protein